MTVFVLSLQIVCMHHLSKQLPGFSNLSRKVSGNRDFQKWVETVDPEHSVPELWETESELSTYRNTLVQIYLLFKLKLMINPMAFTRGCYDIGDS